MILDSRSRKRMSQCSQLITENERYLFKAINNLDNYQQLFQN